VCLGFGRNPRTRTRIDLLLLLDPRTESRKSEISYLMLVLRNFCVSPLSADIYRKTPKIGTDDAQGLRAFRYARLMMVMRKEENSLKGLETLQRVVPFAPFATSFRMGWKGLQAVRYRENSADDEISMSSVSSHVLSLGFRRPEKLNLHYGGINRDSPLPTGSIAVVPGGSSVLWRRQGGWTYSSFV
jgi:hypothetical protein